MHLMLSKLRSREGMAASHPSETLLGLVVRLLCMLTRLIERNLIHTVGLGGI